MAPAILHTAPAGWADQPHGSRARRSRGRAENCVECQTDNWIGTWSASPQPIWDADFFAPLNIPRSLFSQTVRQIAHVSIGGNRVRVVLSNEYGTRPLVVGAAHVAIAGNGSSIATGSDRPLTFGGRSAFTIPPGAPAVSDPVDLAVTP